MHKKTQKNSSIYIYGIHPALLAIENPKRKIYKISCSESVFEKHKKQIQDFKHQILPNNKISNLLPENSNHQGIVVECSTIELEDIKHLTINDNSKVAILDQITDPHNIGAIIRSAAAFNIDAIIMPKNNSPSENPVTAKTACGGLEKVQIFRVTNINKTIQYLKQQGFWVTGMDLKGQDITNNKALEGKVAIILGAEGKGMRRLTAEHCDFNIKIPMSENMESLNVSNAAAIIFHECFKLQK